MPWVGGIFTQTNGVNTGPTLWALDQAQGFNIITSHHDTHDQDIATGLQNCITVDGLNKLAASFIPAADATYNIGSTTVRFQNEYLSGSLFLYNGNTNSIGLVADTLTGSRTVTIPDVSGAMVVTVATQTLTNKTLTSPTINGGTLASPTVTTPAITGGTLAGATVTTPAITGAIFGPEGTSTGQGGALRLEELAANGTNVTGFHAPDALAADVIYTMPAADGSSGNALTTNGSKVLSWTALTTGTVTSVATAGLATGGPITGTGTVTVPAANAATTLAGTDATQALTAAGFAGNKSLATSGFYKLPGGLIIQWGSNTVAASTTSTFNFPTTFSGGTFSFVVSSTTLGDTSSWGGQAISVTQYSLSNAHPSITIGFNWIAIGSS